MTVKQLFKEFSLRDVHMKIDCEACEWEIFAASTDLFKDKNVIKTLAGEVHLAGKPFHTAAEVKAVDDMLKSRECNVNLDLDPNEICCPELQC